MSYHVWRTGGAVITLMFCGQCEGKMAHTKFGVNMSKLCKGTASGAVWHLFSKFVDAINENRFVYRHEIHSFLPAWSEDDPSQIWLKLD